jgi:hypothetical protein
LLCRIYFGGCIGTERFSGADFARAWGTVESLRLDPDGCLARLTSRPNCIEKRDCDLNQSRTEEATGIQNRGGPDPREIGSSLDHAPANGCPEYFTGHSWRSWVRVRLRREAGLLIPNWPTVCFRSSFPRRACPRLDRGRDPIGSHLSELGWIPAYAGITENGEDRSPCHPFATEECTPQRRVLGTNLRRSVRQ